MPKKTTHSLFKNALIELELIVQQLELDEAISNYPSTLDKTNNLPSKPLLANQTTHSDSGTEDTFQSLESFTDE